MARFIQAVIRAFLGSKGSEPDDAQLIPSATQQLVVQQPAASNRLDDKDAGAQPPALAAPHQLQRYAAAAFSPGLLIAHQYRIIRRIGAGGMGVVYACADLHHDIMVAVKVAVHCATTADGRLPAGFQQHPTYRDLQAEVRAYKSLQARRGPGGLTGIPQMYHHGHPWTQAIPGTQQRLLYSFLAMQMLGPSIHDLCIANTYRNNSQLFTRHASAMLRALRSMHGKGLVHGDVKPRNFATPFHDDAGQVYYCGAAPSDVYCIDLGLAVAWKQEPEYSYYTADIPAYAGTPDYSSVRCLKGYHPTPRDDLESLGFCFIEMLAGQLPWAYGPGQSADDAEQRWPHSSLPWLATDKAAKLTALMTKGLLPPVFVAWHTYVTSLTPTEDIDYQLLLWLIRTKQAGPRQMMDADALVAEFEAQPAAAAAAAAAAGPSPRLVASSNESSGKRTAADSCSCTAGAQLARSMPAPAGKRARLDAPPASSAEE